MPSASPIFKQIIGTTKFHFLPVGRFVCLPRHLFIDLNLKGQADSFIEFNRGELIEIITSIEIRYFVGGLQN